ncbi:MAG TPA: hypothetical protein VF088_17125 [Pyrinomonadaceae bacterium]
MQLNSNKVIRCGLSVIVLLILLGQCASATNQPAVSTVFAVLVKRLEIKTASLNQEFTLLTISDVIVDGVNVIPSGSRVVGRVVELATKGKESEQSTLAIVIDKAVLEDGREIALQGIIAAIAAAQDGSLPSDPTYGMMHSNEPKMIGLGPGGGARPGELSPSSKAESTATLNTARVNGEMRKGLLLNAESQGAIGFSGLSLSWRLTTPPPVTVFSSNRKEIKFEAGTQVLLRMARPDLKKMRKSN